MSETVEYKLPYPKIPLEGLRGRDGYEYVPDSGLVAAANAALALQMPLLITGEAGCGKTDFAFAAAEALASDASSREGRGELLECYVRSDSRARDLLYHYDAIRRFGDAQHGGESGRQRAEDPRLYIKLQPLGCALMSSRLRVVLIDEIDKAPRDLPNDLLRELDQGHFEIVEIPDEPMAGAGERSILAEDPRTYQNQMKRPDLRVRPFVIITSNVERQLPDPFLRRCVFFHIPFPDEEALRRILRSRFDPSEVEPALIDQVLDVFSALRAVPALTKKPATSEVINWVTALATVHEPARVAGSIRNFSGGRRVRDVPWAELRWMTLPAIGCLIKLREDQDRLARSS